MFFVLGKRYTIYDILACLCMTIGLIFFTLADSQVQPEFDLLGKNEFNISSFL
jgi:adenosine 3'-phospho 5'-phosphosulfate transporter B3